MEINGYLVICLLTGFMSVVEKVSALTHSMYNTASTYTDGVSFTRSPCRPSAITIIS